MYRLLDRQPEFVLIDKLPGVHFHRDTAAVGDGLLDRLRADLGMDTLYPVHRLDAMTSGLLLFATTPAAAAELAAAFREHTVDKFYLAVSDRKPAKKQGRISGDMERGRRGGWKLLPTHENPAVTQFYSTSLAPGLRLFLLRPRTGRTHQLRVALKSLGAPILGDPLYHPTGTADEAPADRGYLHAWALCFQLGGREWRYVCPPQDGRLFAGAAFETAVAPWREPWLLPWPKA